MHDVQEEGLRESKKRATRRELSRTTRRLALEHGYDAVTVEQVCSEVGVSVRTFHNYFASKDEAALGEDPPLATPEQRAAFLAGAPHGDLLADLLALADTEPEPGLQDDVAATSALAQREPRLLALWLGRVSTREEELRSLVAERLGTDEDDARCAAAAALAMTTVRLAWTGWMAEPATGLRAHLDLVHEQLRSLVAPAHAPAPETAGADR